MTERYDVAVVGYGPVGEVLANLLGRDGVRTLVVEREPSVYHLPRAAHFDHEIMRVFQGLGLADAVLPCTAGLAGTDFVNADGKVLFGFDGPEGPTAQGWDRSYMFHQPELERALRVGVERFAEHVEVWLEHEVTSLGAGEEDVELEVLDRRSGTSRTVRASWLVGCDGARSAVRRMTGIALEDLGFDEPWLVTDVLVGDDVDLPARLHQYCDPARPTTYVPMPGHRRRFEFMVLPEDDPVALEQPERVHELLRPWLAPEQCQIERARVYTFHAILARRWRAGRVLLAGDSAHQMPPFLGQGMCSGIRDAANLAWKLRLVLDGEASDALLDTYQSERAPHVRRIVEQAVSAGGVICTTDPEVAAARDAFFLAGNPPPGDGEHRPELGPGLVDPDGSRWAGRLSAQPRVRGGALLDDVTGTGFVLLARDDPGSRLDPELARWFAGLGGRSVAWGPIDVEGGVAAWFGEMGAAVALVRPDRYVFGTSPDAEGATALVGRLAEAVAG